MFIIGALYFSEPKHNIMNLNVQFDKNNLGDYISTYVKKELEEWSGQELDKKIIFHGITMQNPFITTFLTSLLPNNGDQIIDVLEPKLAQKCQNILNYFDFANFQGSQKSLSTND